MTQGSPPTAFIHIGLQKTGTSYLQSVLHGSADVVAGQGLRLVPRTNLESFHVMLAVLGTVRKSDPPSVHGALDTLRAQVAATEAPRILLSQESLAAATPKQAGRLVDALDGREVHVVVTVRDVARQLPSVWQQKVKAGATVAYPDFLEAVVARNRAGRPFWRFQDVPRVLASWRTVVPPQRIHVITVPPAGSPPRLLLERFCAVLGVDPQSLSETALRRNSRLGLPQTELLRLANVALGDRKPPGRSLERTRKFYLAGQVLGAQAGPPALAPARLRDWCAEVTDRHLDAITGSSYHVVGELDDLRPQDSAFSDAPQEADDAELVRASAEALAQLLLDRDQDRRELRTLRQRAFESAAAGWWWARPGAGRRWWGRLVRHDGASVADERL